MRARVRVRARGLGLGQGLGLGLGRGLGRGLGEHKKKTWEGPNGQGTRHVGTHVNAVFLRKQKEQQQTGNKNCKRREKSANKSQATGALTTRS